MQDLQALRAFVTVAREGSVSRAAERLHLTQPAVSLKLKQFQASLGLTLFQRRPKGLALTEDGRALLSAAEKALAAVAAFEQSARALHSTLRGRLKIGTIVDPEFIRLGAFLHRLVERAPQLETELTHGMSGTVLEWVRRGARRGVLLAPPGEGPGLADIAYRELTQFHYHVIAPAGWAAAWLIPAGPSWPPCPGSSRLRPRSTTGCCMACSTRLASPSTASPRWTRKPACSTWYGPAWGSAWPATPWPWPSARSAAWW